MPVAKPSTVPRWADGGTNTPTNVVQPPEHSSSIPAWAAGNYTTLGQTVMRGGNEYIVLAFTGTGPSTGGPVGTGTTVEGSGGNTLTWGFVTSTPVTKDSGWLPNIQPPAQIFNWLFFWIYQWILWVQDIANQNFDGSGSPAVGPWTGKHLFTGGTSGVTPTAAVTITAASGSGIEGAPGINSTGGASTTANGGVGGIFNGGANGSVGSGADAIQGNGSGTGNGGTFQGGTSGTTSGGLGVLAEAGPGAVGGSFIGGPVPSGGGSAGRGINVLGGAGEAGAEINAGSGNANGCEMNASGTGSGGVGISFGTGPALAGIALGSGSAVKGIAGSGAALEANDGGILFSGTQPVNPPADVMSRSQYPKAVLIVQFSGGTATVLKATNIAPGVSIVGSTTLQWNFVVDMADANYGLTFGVISNSAVIPHGLSTFNTTHLCGIGLWTTSGGNQDLTTWTGILTINVWGDQ